VDAGVSRYDRHLPGRIKVADEKTQFRK